MVFAVKTSSVATTAFLVGLVFPFPHRELLLKTLYSAIWLFSFLHKIKFSRSHFWSFVQPWFRAACLCFHFVFPFVGAVHWYSVPLEGFPYFMSDDNRWILLLGPFIVSFWGWKFRETKLKKKSVLSALKIEWHSLLLMDFLVSADVSKPLG